jgi:hypothetical protein
VRTNAVKKSYIQEEEGKYELLPQNSPFPAPSPNVQVRKILELVDGKQSIRDIMSLLGIDPTFQVVNQLRMQSTTSAFPYLRSTNIPEE